MKKVILLALLMPATAFGQIHENFESGTALNWVQSTENRWSADTSSSLSGIFSLHHIYDNPDAGSDQIGIRISTLHPSESNTKWSFLVRYGYDPSSQNNWSAFLMSDIGPEGMSSGGGARGFAAGVNMTGSDDTLRLWKIDGNKVTSVVNSGINWQADIGTATSVKIVIERSGDGNWNIYVYSINGDPLGSGSGVDNELFGIGWFGIYYRYSSTKDRLLWLDDISIDGVFHEDTTAPFVTGCAASGRNSVEVSFNEEPSAETLLPENFALNDREIKPVSVNCVSSLNYLVEFSSCLENRQQNYLIISRVCDPGGNCTQNVRLEFTPSWAGRGDVVISEIMADPSPSVSLPVEEYIEITNRTGYPVNLKSWTLSNSGQASVFPEAVLAPSGIAIICSSSDTLIFKKYGKVIGIKLFPALTDGGRLLYISDSTGNLIHGVEYSSNWYHDDLKSGGGWSLEMIDTGFPFFDSDNWTASVSKLGGSPGLRNSTAGTRPDIYFDGIQNVFPADSMNITIRFDEPVFDFIEKTGSITLGDKTVSYISAEDPLYRVFNIVPESPLDRTNLYMLSVPGEITDFAGNLIKNANFNFGLPARAAAGDILFNEILFNPLPGDPDYLELYNCSDKVFDVSRLQLVTVNDAAGTISEPVTVSDEARCLFPNEYYAVTTGKKLITDRYFSAGWDHLFETGSLPSMPDDKGHLVLYNMELEKIDELIYTDDMQFPLLVTDEGVALEKTDPYKKSGESAAWHSASESSGWGTPGAVNSVFTEMPASTDEVVLSSTKITPDSDGFEDFLTISFNLAGNGNVVSATVFDEAGNFVKRLEENMLAGTKASVTWDGTARDGSSVRTGIYIILITLYNDSGRTARWKKVCTVIR